MNVALRSFNVLSLCTGGGGLDLGVRLAVPSARAVCYVEREVAAAALLVAHMQTGALDDAPLWTDLRTFDGRPWRGVVDCVIGGIPCQPFSVAGKRRGEHDDRNLWPDALRIIEEIKPECCFFENVPGMANRSVDWYVFRAIEPRLQEMGYRVESGFFSAAEVGAPHERKRLFILAHARECARGAEQGQQSSERPHLSGPRWLQAGTRAREHAGSEPETGRRAMGNAARGQGDIGGPGGVAGTGRSGERIDAAAGDAGGDMGGADRQGLEIGIWPGRHSQAPREASRTDARTASNGSLDDTEQPRCRQVALPETGRSATTEPEWAGIGSFPPSPKERDRWAAILARYPDLAPAVADTARDDRPRLIGQSGRGRRIRRTSDDDLTIAPCPDGDGRWHVDEYACCVNDEGLARLRAEIATESPVRDVADGLASGLVRRDRLSILGNGVCPPQAALAWQVLYGRFLAPGRGAGE